MGAAATMVFHSSAVKSDLLATELVSCFQTSWRLYIFHCRPVQSSLVRTWPQPDMGMPKGSAASGVEVDPAPLAH
jgi:hypothetical protein